MISGEAVVCNKTSKQLSSSMAMSAKNALNTVGKEDDPDCPVVVNASMVEESLFDCKLNDDYLSK